EEAEPWKVRAEELEQKIDALKQSIESGVQLKGSVVALDNGDDVPITAVDDGTGKYVLRVVEAAPAGYEEATDSLRAKIINLIETENVGNRVEVIHSLHYEGGNRTIGHNTAV